MIGAFLIYGAKKRLTFLVDPPEWLWPFYGQALVKKVFGSPGVIRFTYFCGVLLVVVASLVLLQNLFTLAIGLGWIQP